MANEKKAGTLILSQIRMFNEAKIHFEDVVEKAILDVIDKMLEMFSKDIGWNGEFELAGENSNCWLAPAEWHIAGSEEKAAHKAYFDMETNDGDNDYWTALFCQQGSTGGEAGFMFTVNPKFINIKDWKAHMSKIDSTLISKLKKLDFQPLENGNFFLPVYLEVDQLVKVWENYDETEDIKLTGECLSPLNVALQKLNESWVTFDTMVGSLATTTSSKLGKS